MKILYIHQYFILPSEPGGTRSYWICQELIKRGHQVTMLTSISTLNKEQKEKRIMVDGIDVIYLDIPYHGSMSIHQRALAFFKFAFQSSYWTLREESVDLVYATSTPLTVGLPALLRKFFKNTPFIFEVRDLWPEVPIQMGGIKNPLMIKLSRWFEKVIYKNAIHIIALSPGMKDGILKLGIADSKISLAPNMSKTDRFWPREPNQNIAQNHHINCSKFNVIYFGALGLANDLDYILQAAKILQVQDPEVHFTFAGGGGMKAAFSEKVALENVSNIRILKNLPMDELSEVINLCDTSLVTFLPLPILQTNSPNKLFDSIASGKPVIVNSYGWTKDLVEKHQFGLVADPHDPEDLANKIIALKNNPEERKRMGLNARKLAVSTFDKSIICSKVADVIEALNLDHDCH